MLADEIEAPGEVTPEGLLGRYEASLAAVVEEAGRDRVAEATGLDPGAVAAVESGDAADLPLEDAAAVLALSDGAPDREAVLAEARDRLLLEMSSAVLTVDRIAADYGGAAEPKEIQAKIEGRLPMTLGEYARLHHFVASEK